MNNIIKDIKAGIAALEKAHVTPMGLAIYKNSWQLFKFKALPGHPNPKNAGYGFSHPTSMSAFKKAKGDSDFDISLIKSLESAHDIAHKIGKELGFPDAEIGHVAETGEILQIILLRGGAQDFLTNDIQAGNQDKVTLEDRQHLVDEETNTDNFISSWGGSRPGAGRKPTGRKNKAFYITDEEHELLKKYLDKLRKKEGK